MQGYNNCDMVWHFGQEWSVGQLWLGDFVSARNRKLHREVNIQTVITAGLGMKVAVSNNTKHRVYALYDHPQEDIQRYFSQAYEHLEEALQKGNVLVHCYAGVSRSSTVVISYLMKKLGWSYKQTVQQVRKQRWVCNPNPGFVKQLKRYEQHIKIFDNPQAYGKGEKGFNTSGISLTGGKSSLGSNSPLSPLLTNSRVGSIPRQRSLRMDQKNTSKIHNYSLVKRK